MIDFTEMSDTELLSRVQRLVQAYRSVSAKLLIHLAEVDARGLYRDQGYTSLFEYCREALRMSEAEAYLRMEAARRSRKFPLILERIEAGELNLTAIKLVGMYLTPDNHVELLDRVKGMKKREVEQLVAELAPKPDVPARIRRLPSPPAAVALPLPEPKAQPAVETFALQAPQPRAATKPLSPGRFKVELTLGQEAHDKLEQLRELLRHQVPDGDLAQIVTLAITELLDKTMQRRFAVLKRVPKEQRGEAPKAAEQPKQPSRHIPRKVLRKIHERDGGRCTFVSDDGHRCEAKGFLEVHHHNVTFARGGAASVDNLRLMCRSHNALLAERDYGQHFMRERVSSSIAQRKAGEQLSMS